jgi:hypothetical protein
MFLGVFPDRYSFVRGSLCGEHDKSVTGAAKQINFEEKE